MQRTFEDIKKAIMEAENWGISDEEKEAFLKELHWTFLGL